MEVVRKSTSDEWKSYGEILRRIDEAKQWIVGDWLVDGMNHFELEHGPKSKHGGTGLYEEAERLLGVSRGTLQNQKSIAEQFKFSQRCENLTWVHHCEVAPIKSLVESKKGKLRYGDTNQEKIQEMLAKAEENRWSTRELHEEVKRYQRQQDEMIRLANEPEKYSVIYADPPWKYSDKLIEGYGAAEHHYPPMSIKELCSLPVKHRAADNAVLFMWVTAPFADEWLPIIQAWGFEYKAQFVWDKVKHNFGHYNSVRHELLLICTRGTYLPETNELKDSVISIERSEEHSSKPEEFRELIDALYPTGNRIELFARKAVPGWDRWGDESE
jgi:N6-adenosine-specific RNA methylase IME4